MNKLLTILLALFIVSCGGSSEKKENSGSEETAKMDRKEKLRFNQYKVKGMELYKTYCVACHQANGEGLASLYPPLKGSDYLMADLARAACIIKNGQTEEIVVNGETYSQMMPGLGNLTPLEIAEIITYITNEWGNEKGLTGVKEVEEWLKACQ